MRGVFKASFDHFVHGEDVGTRDYDGVGRVFRADWLQV